MFNVVTFFVEDYLAWYNIVMLQWMVWWQLNNMKHSLILESLKEMSQTIEQWPKWALGRGRDISWSCFIILHPLVLLDTMNTHFSCFKYYLLNYLQMVWRLVEQCFIEWYSKFQSEAGWHHLRRGQTQMRGCDGAVEASSMDMGGGGVLAGRG